MTCDSFVLRRNGFPRLLAILVPAIFLSTVVLGGCGSSRRSAVDDVNASTGGAAGGDGNSGSGSASGGSSGSSGGSGGVPPTGPTSAELISRLSIGWNLGNSLDAPEGETAWGNPVITQALLQAVADSGFDVVRIPVTWSLHTGSGPDYAIDSAWLDRVEEVVQYALDSGLHAIINLHHDGADGLGGDVEWIRLDDSSGAVTEQNNAAVQARFVAVWSQIAEYFRSHDERLLFESMNEIHDGYANPDPRYHDIINSLNQVFVDTVRASGGNNIARHLIVPGYNTNIDQTLDGFALPNDPSDNRLILSVHYYDPWDFAGAAETNVWGEAATGETFGQEGHAVNQFDKLDAAYIENGLPVIIGEYGAVHQQGYESYRRYYMEYVTKAAADRGIVPIYWDNGSEGSGEESFGLFDRDDNTVQHPTIVEAMIRAATSSYSLQDIETP